ncbi:MAG: hypothetical protein GF347_01595 [Candidatus Moranbacteria bacterium]|nr:hypothetical protein [Candidatus Moranbacteria bacterium]
MFKSIIVLVSVLLLLPFSFVFSRNQLDYEFEIKNSDVDLLESEVDDLKIDNKFKNRDSNIVVNKTKIDFKKAIVQNINNFTELKIINAGKKVLTVSNISIFDGNNFEIEPKYGENPCKNYYFELLEDEFCTVGVNFYPQKEGTYKTKIQINSDDPSYDTLFVEVKGSAILADEKDYFKIYHFINKNTARHYFTVSAKEERELEYAHGDIWDYKGIYWYKKNNKNLPELDKANIYCFYSFSSDRYYYTDSLKERDFVLENWDEYWTYLGNSRIGNRSWEKNLR